MDIHLPLQLITALDAGMMKCRSVPVHKNGRFHGWELGGMGQDLSRIARGLDLIGQELGRIARDLDLNRIGQDLGLIVIVGKG